MHNYKLVNPIIVGDFNKSVSAASPSDAAADIWSSISKYVVGDVPQFGFTLMNEGDNKLHHFMVKESAGGSKDAKFSIEELTHKMKPVDEKKFIDYTNSISDEAAKSQTGGKKHRFDDHKKDDSSSSSSSSDSIYERARLFERSNYTVKAQQPMVYWWYSPLLYTKLSPQFTSYYIPTFVVPLRPYVEIDLNSAFFG